jgi:hypothetical protein
LLYFLHRPLGFLHKSLDFLHFFHIALGLIHKL